MQTICTKYFNLGPKWPFKELFLANSQTNTDTLGQYPALNSILKWQYLTIWD